MNAMQFAEAHRIAEMFVIRKKGTQLLMPAPAGKRGGSQVEPVKFEQAMPRFFPHEHAAKCFINQWVKGKFYNVGHDGDMEVEIRPQIGRNKNDLEIVPVLLFFKEAFA